MKTIYVCGAVGVGMAMAHYLAERNLPIILDCTVPGGPMGGPAADVHVALADYSEKEFRDAFEFKYGFPITEALKQEIMPKPHFEPPQFNGYMKRTHRRRK